MTPKTAKKFNTLAEVDAYLSAKKLQCLECGKSFVMLGKHLKSHGMTPKQYKLKWGIPQERGLAGVEYRQAHSDKLSAMREEGKINHDHLADAAKRIDYDSRTALTSASKAAHIEFLAREQPYNAHRISDGGKRANGKDATREREYQRQYRTKKRNSPP
ncbi:MucR family transcriptional regulator [Pseudoalteromonas sp. Isolate6]|uniref:MucR family transcriptional regulator n=1 Tax=Pseudoalteromonas sp. Isolate6 TaxID=2908527 RepID=UPI001EFC6968|nr:MucR family transcriptional regulator [Pseudoalteromonas sp. Isolate6]MCG9761698.1 MucR family transcriptional regulator [Pseudoalteromonas sp. Isolate6]